jgi:hypothetical protein
LASRLEVGTISERAAVRDEKTGSFEMPARQAAGFRGGKYSDSGSEDAENFLCFGWYA